MTFQEPQHTWGTVSPPSSSAFAMARLYMRRDWEWDPRAIQDTAKSGVSETDRKVLALRFGEASEEVGRALGLLCVREVERRE